MKKLLILLSVVLFATQTQAQKDYYLTPVAIDNSVTVAMPKEYKTSTVNGQQTFAANGEYGTMLVIRSVNPPATMVENEKGLNNVFKDYIKKVQSSLSKGTIINDHDSKMGKLEVCDFILQVDTGSGVQSRHFRLLYTKNVTYTFEYLYDDFRKDLATGEINAFLGSIKTAPDLDRDDQYVITSNAGQSVIVKIVLFGLLPLSVVIGMIVFFHRRSVSFN